MSLSHEKVLWHTVLVFLRRKVSDQGWIEAWKWLKVNRTRSRILTEKGFSRSSIRAQAKPKWKPLKPFVFGLGVFGSLWFKNFAIDDGSKPASDDHKEEVFSYGEKRTPTPQWSSLHQKCRSFALIPFCERSWFLFVCNSESHTGRLGWIAKHSNRCPSLLTSNYNLSQKYMAVVDKCTFCNTSCCPVLDNTFQLTFTLAQGVAKCFIAQWTCLIEACSEVCGP